MLSIQIITGVLFFVPSLDTRVFRGIIRGGYLGLEVWRVANAVRAITAICTGVFGGLRRFRPALCLGISQPDPTSVIYRDAHRGVRAFFKSPCEYV